MKQRPRIYYTDTQKALMWERWRAGDSLQSIAQLLIVTTPPFSAFWLKPVVFDLHNDIARPWR